MATALPLLCHWNGDGDIARAWLEYYTVLGVTEFHIILHGPEEESAEFLEAARDFPVVIRDRYTGTFDEREKVRRLNDLVSSFVGQWVLVVDSDEFVELPLVDVGMLTARLEFFGQTFLYAPFVQRFRADGSLDTPPVMPDPFAEMPLCDPKLAVKVGYSRTRSKYPLILVGDDTRIANGNHRRPNPTEEIHFFLGATHHFKWKKGLKERLRMMFDSRVLSVDPYHAAVAHLQGTGWMLPTDDGFVYTRQAMFDRGLLREPSAREVLRRCARMMLDTRSVPASLIWRSRVLRRWVLRRPIRQHTSTGRNGGLGEGGTFR